MMFGVYLLGRYSLVFIDEGHQLELSFWYKCRSDRVEQFLFTPQRLAFMTRHQFFPTCPPFVNTVYWFPAKILNYLRVLFYPH